MEKQPSQQADFELIKYNEIADQLLAMCEVDQKMRGDPKNEWDDEVDPRNTEAVKKIIAQIGWPTVSKVGMEASHAAWLLVQHADKDVAFQEYCLSLMKAQPPGEVQFRDIAYLVDRICVNSKRGQVYGTQMNETWDENGQTIAYQPQPIEDREHVDERRASMGMGPLEKYVEEITAEYFPQLLSKKSE
jgi:hypothetical protein